MGAPAARIGDAVVGADTHIVMVPSATGSVPTPIPGHPFSGQLTSGGVGTVRIDGELAAVVGTIAVNDPQHVPLPPGVSFQRPPTNRGEVSRGSSSVTVGGKAAARLGDAVRSCNDPKDAETSSIVSGSGTVSIG
jgi:uncharacterized Zn-binding protein involved in type VI secretion